MDEKDIIRGLEYYFSATKRSSGVIPGTYRSITRYQLMHADPTIANVVWKTAQFLVVPLSGTTLDLDKCIEGWFKFFVGVEQKLILQDDQGKWTYYKRERDQQGKDTYSVEYEHNRIEKLINQIDEDKNLSNSFQTYCNKNGLYFPLKLIQRFIASLCTKPFVILTGLSGSGKTKLALEFAKWITDENLDQYKVIAVGADWTNREPLIGFPNALDKKDYVKPENKALDLVIKASESIGKDDKQYFLILDEMNLSHVERYFSDFLSSMESGLEIELHNSDSIAKVPKSVGFPKNLFVIGTVNIDETTYMFSPKVLDRANTIEFRLTEAEMSDYLSKSYTTGNSTGKGTKKEQETFKRLAQDNSNTNINQNIDLLCFFTELKKIGAEFGYRTVNEIKMLMYKLEFLGVNNDDLLDIAIMQKLLPKVHGSRSKLTKLLPILGGLCLNNDKENIKEEYLDKYVSNDLNESGINLDSNIKYKISFEKICRMYKNAIENGFASYAEA
jgi:5-methylcytosine-specific restriction enzyme B